MIDFLAPSTAEHKPSELLDLARTLHKEKKVEGLCTCFISLISRFSPGTPFVYYYE